MKTVFPNSYDCILRWSLQTQAYGQNAKKTVYFKGTRVFSYGDHFPMANFVERGGNRALIISTDRYSPTTTRHQHYVWKVTHHLSIPKIYCSRDFGNMSREERLAKAKEMNDDLLTKAALARKPENSERYLREALYNTQLAERINAFQYDGQPYVAPTVEI